MSRINSSSITAPTPFLETMMKFQLADRAIWQVQYEYLYLYKTYPAVTICPSAGKLIIDGISLNIVSFAQLLGKKRA